MTAYCAACKKVVLVERIARLPRPKILCTVCGRSWPG